jgi:ornithine cyclodeaminase/alanine dehydrogenase
MKTRLLSRKDIESFFTMRLCVEAVERAFADLAQGKATMPQRTPIGVPEHHGVALFMPAHIKSLGALGAKVVTVYKDNMAKHKLPTVLGTIILLDEATGFPIALMDGGFLTAMRTGAVSGVASRYMARPDAKIAAIFGTGVQAFTQVLGVHETRPLAKLLAYSIDPMEARQSFAERITAKIGVPVELTNDPAATVAQADIVILATSAATPVVDGRWFRPGVHINGIGSHAPKMRELDTLTVQRSRVVCDLTSACQAEAGDLMIPAEAGEWSWDKVAGNLGDVVTGTVAGRTSPEEITLFKSVGLAVQDMSAARAVFDEAVKRGIGTEFQF